MAWLQLSRILRSLVTVEGVPASTGSPSLTAILPPSPLLVPELTGQAPFPQQLRTIVDGVQQLFLPAPGPIAIVYHDTPALRTAHRGSLRAWGANVEVGGGYHLSELVIRATLNRWGYSGPIVSIPLTTESLPGPAQASDSESALNSAPAVVANPAGQMRTAVAMGDLPRRVIVAAEGGCGLAAHAPLGQVAEAEAVERALAAFVASPHDHPLPERILQLPESNAFGFDAAPWRFLQKLVAVGTPDGAPGRPVGDDREAQAGQVECQYHWASAHGDLDDALGMGFHVGVWAR